MPPTLEKRVEELERKFSEFSKSKDSWKQTFGRARDDEGFEELVRLGQEYRRNLNGRDDGSPS